MQTVVTAVLASGVEFVGFVDFTSVPKIGDDGKMRANNLIGELVEVEHFWIEKPLRSQSIPTAQGIANILTPVAQTSAVQPDETKIFVRAKDVLMIAASSESIEGNYRQQFSKIALPTGAGRLGLVK